MSTNRKAQVFRQSPGLVAKTDRAAGSYKTQLNSAVNQKTEPEVYRALAAEPGDHAHHKVILETLDRLFMGLNPEEQSQLRDYINQQGIATGNNIRNLVNVPGAIHQGGIHKFARERGYEIDSKNNPTGLALDILEASTVPSLEYRKHIADRYINEAVPAMNNHLNELLTEFYAQQGGKRNAGDAMRLLAGGNNTGRKSIEDMSSGNKNVTINAENVYMEKAVNGNGKNGKH